MRLSKHVTLTETEDGAVLLNRRSGQYWQLNRSGAVVVRVLLAGGDEDEAAHAVTARYPVDRDRALADVRSLTAELRRARLVGPGTS